MEGAKAATVRRTGSWRDSTARELRFVDSFKSAAEADEAVSSLQQAAVVKSKALLPRRSNMRSPRGSDPERAESHSRPAPQSEHSLENSKDVARTDILSQAVALHATHSDAKHLHWDTGHAAHVTSQQSTQQQMRELQVLNSKLTTDLAEAKAANEMLHKQVHKVQTAMVQSRDDMENAQRLAVAAEQRATTAEEQLTAAQAKIDKLGVEVQQLLQSGLSSHINLLNLSQRAGSDVAIKAAFDTG